MGEHPAAVRMGWAYTQQLYEQGFERGVQQYVPFVRTLARYFAVDARYVRRKLRILLLPALSLGPIFRTTTQPPPSAFADDEEVGGGSVIGKSGSGGALLPRDDVQANDLYIPLVGILAYTVLCGAIANSPTRPPAETIGAAFTAAVGWIVAEAVVLRGVGSLTGSLPTAPSALELAAVVGMKMAVVDAAIFLRAGMETLGGGGGGAFAAVGAAAYVALAVGLATFRAVGGGDAAQAGRYAALAVAGVDSLVAVWFTLRLP